MRVGERNSRGSHCNDAVSHDAGVQFLPVGTSIALSSTVYYFEILLNLVCGLVSPGVRFLFFYKTKRQFVPVSCFCKFTQVLSTTISFLDQTLYVLGRIKYGTSLIDIFILKLNLN